MRPSFPASDIWWLSLETYSNFLTWGSPLLRDIWWLSLETCLKLFTWGTPLPVTSGGHHWRHVQSFSLDDVPPTGTDIWWSPNHVQLTSGLYFLVQWMFHKSICGPQNFFKIGEIQCILHKTRKLKVLRSIHNERLRKRNFFRCLPLISVNIPMGFLRTHLLAISLSYSLSLNDDLRYSQSQMFYRKPE